MAATSLDALEALLQFRGAASNKGTRPSPVVPSSRSMPVVPNPLDPAQPNVIEGDAPTPIVDRQAAFGSGPMSAFFTSPPPADVSSVPNPLAAAEQRPLTPRPGPPPLSPCKPSVPAQIKIAAHGFGMHQPAAPTPSPGDEHEVEISSDKILSALHSKPQRGKKRQNLSDLERQELTRTRNREHARSTRMKKKARFQELVDIEQKYLLLKQKETLDLRRREQLVAFVENAGLEAKACPHSSRLIRLASRKLRRPEFAVADAVALTTQDSGIVKVSVSGADLDSGEAKTLTGVIGVDFGPSTTDICAASLHWSSLESTASSAGMFPSVSVLSFET